MLAKYSIIRIKRQLGKLKKDQKTIGADQSGSLSKILVLLWFYGTLSQESTPLLLLDLFHSF